MPPLPRQLQDRLVQLALALVDQRRARILVEPQCPAFGFWFGGGNVVESSEGRLHLTGRYRNHGDSRTGLAAGERGLALALFESRDGGRTFTCLWSLTKADLNDGRRQVLSIEGSALHWTGQGVELFVSSEQTGIGYPSGFESYLKPGAGVWVIQRLQADSVNNLRQAEAETILTGGDPAQLHVKDPVVYDTPAGDTLLMFCTHPFSWTSSNTAAAVRRHGQDRFGPPRWDFFLRGNTWDVAISRGTCIVDVPRIGPFAQSQVSLLFYDGGESLRNLNQHPAAVLRPRGYSGEELGGVAYFVDGDLDHIHRLSRYRPLLISPHGTGCSRYVDVVATRGGLLASWQQSQPDFSQPLVGNLVGSQELAALLTG